jgi:hypothetical protein
MPEAVSQDIATWRPKLEADGLIAGHDYTYFPGVKGAVDGFVARHGLWPAFHTSRASWMTDRARS